MMYVSGDSAGAKLFSSANHGYSWKKAGDFGMSRPLGQWLLIL